MDCYLELRRPLGLGVVPLRIQLASLQSPIIIGRGSKADVFLYAGEHPSFVSREHAKLELHSTEDKWLISDMNSVNGMFYNSEKLDGDDQRVLSNGDRVYFGNPQHSFFVEYEFVTSKNCFSPALQDSAADYSSDAASTTSSCWSPIQTSRKTSLSRVAAEFAPFRDSPDLMTSTITTTTNYSSLPSSMASSFSHEDVPDDLWTCRILKCLDMRELQSAGWACRSWMRRANACVDIMDVIRWKHPWSVECLGVLLEKKAMNTSHPVSRIITEGCYKVRDDHVERFARACGEKLIHVDFSGTPTLTPNGMRALARHCPNLKTLIVRGCKRVGGGSWDWMESISRNGTLEYCDLHCAGSNDLVVTKLANLSPCLKRVDLGVMCTEGVSDVGLTELIEHCPLLEHVDLRGCKRVTNQGISLLVQRCGSRLKTLVLHSCGIGDDALHSIGQYCSVLEMLDVHRCVSITDKGVLSLVQGEGKVAESLKHLDLSNLTISDSALSYIAKACMHIQTLDLRSCKHITGAGLIPLAKSLSRTLLKLDLNGCCDIIPIDVIAIVKSCSGVLEELEIGAKEEDCKHWSKKDVLLIRSLLGTKTRVHDAFDFPDASKRIVDNGFRLVL